MSDKLYSELNKGDWDSETTYTTADFVSHDGSSYVCIATTTNNEPPNATYWALIAEKGDTGATGLTGATGVTGATGETGPAGVSAGLKYTFDAVTTDSDPGSGKLRLNNATLASVTSIYLDNLDGDAADISSFLDTWDDSTNTTLTGIVIIRKVSAKENYAIFSVTGSVTDGTGYRKVAVTYVGSSGSFSADDEISVEFGRTGNKGADGAGTGDVVGPSSATNNAIVRFDATTGKLVQNSGVTIDDSNVVLIPSLTASEIVATDASKNLVSLAVATYPSLTELSYVKGVTSAIQTQLNAKAALISPSFTTPTLGVATATSINKVTITAPATAATLTVADGASLITVGAYAITLTATATTGVTLPTTGTLATLALVETFTNKRITKRTGTTTSHATPTINTDNVDFYSITAQAEAITSFTTNLSGTPTEAQTLWIVITGTAARAITWGASFEASTVALPTTTVTTARLDVGFVWNTVTSKWRCVASV